MSQKKSAVVVIVLCLVAAVLYNSWPLGYWLDSQTAHNALASDLEKINHPYFWLFISGDVLAGLSAFAAALIIGAKHRVTLNTKAWSGVYWGLLIFGIFTAMDALLPAQCTLNPLLMCGGSLQDQGLSIDAVNNAIAAAGLFTSLISINLERKSQPSSSAVTLGRTTLGIAIAWTASSLLFGLLAIAHAGAAHPMQKVQLTLSGAALVIIATNVYVALKINAST